MKLLKLSKLFERKTDCALCNDKITKDSNVKVEYLKINGNIGIYMMHDKCYKKIKKYERTGA